MRTDDAESASGGVPVTSPWAVPGTAVEQPSRPVGPEGALGTLEPVDATGRPDPLPSPPLPLRPMTIADLLDGSFVILKRRARDVLLIAAAFVIPVQLLASVLLRDTLSAGGFAGTGLGETSSVGVEESGDVTGIGASIVSIGVGAVSLALLAGALALLVADWYEGTRRPPSRIVLATVRRLPALVVGVTVVHLLEAVGLVALGVGAYVAMGLLHVVAPAITAEGIGPFRAIGRSVNLTRARFWRSMAVPFLVGVVGSMVGLGFAIVPEVFVPLVPDDWTWLLRATASMLSQLVTAPFTAGVAVLYHLDLRIRTEGLDLARRVEARQGAT